LLEEHKSGFKMKLFAMSWNFDQSESEFKVQIQMITFLNGSIITLNNASLVRNPRMVLRQRYSYSNKN
jgi:hypothetical protein